MLALEKPHCGVSGVPFMNSTTGAELTALSMAVRVSVERNDLCSAENREERRGLRHGRRACPKTLRCVSAPQIIRLMRDLHSILQTLRAFYRWVYLMMRQPRRDRLKEARECTFAARNDDGSDKSREAGANTSDKWCYSKSDRIS